MLDLQRKYKFEKYEILFDYKTYSIHPNSTPVDVWDRIQAEDEFKFLYKGIGICYDYDNGTSIDGSDGIEAYNEWINEFKKRYGSNL